MDVYKGSYEPSKEIIESDGSKAQQYRYLGCNYTINKSKKTLRIDQFDLIEKILDKFKYEN